MISTWRAVRLIWRKEKKLRRTALQLIENKKELEAQKAYLKSVGAVTEQQLNMSAVTVSDGVYAFIDMVGSARIRKHLLPGQYFCILNFCHQIAADTANLFHCRVDNFMGDAVFLQNTPVFDPEKFNSFISPRGRCMLMVLALTCFFRDIEKLKQGLHPLDPEGEVKQLLEKTGICLDFRAGMEIGSAMIGPLGSDKRKIVTAVGKAVNNASRLESSGKPACIQISRRLMDVLKNAAIENDGGFVCKLVRRVFPEAEKVLDQKTEFMKAYQAFYKLNDNPVKKRTDVSYKEFYQKETYLLKTQ